MRTHTYSDTAYTTLPNHSQRYTCTCAITSLVPRLIPSFSMFHAENREGLESEITCTMFRLPFNVANYNSKNLVNISKKLDQLNGVFL